jgi:hypothetical protein
LGLDESLLFGVVPLKSLFRFVGLVQFSAFTVYAAIDTRRALKENVFNQRTAGPKYISDVRSLLTKAVAGATADLPVYISAPVFSVVLLLVVTGLLGRAVPIPA